MNPSEFDLAASVYAKGGLLPGDPEPESLRRKAEHARIFAAEKAGAHPVAREAQASSWPGFGSWLRMPFSRQ
jgi:hypothetical protein